MEGPQGALLGEGWGPHWRPPLTQGLPLLGQRVVGPELLEWVVGQELLEWAVGQELQREGLQGKPRREQQLLLEQHNLLQALRVSVLQPRVQWRVDHV